ncbi:antibiotic biosynthesis monooxygenase [Caulobacter vibrioides]|nr:antibiotic biosynthesis monooxygenase [Caulobacter vibrioides]AZH13088.1 antibiotic biosynthesis monooxygenase [Caulobacter vibrioides]PLR09711.1 antibiotic biosynthesis monooxygenase [Caulobacter vibrioides]
MAQAERPSASRLVAIATERHLIMKNPDSRRGRKDRRKEPRYQVKRRELVRPPAKTLRGASNLDRALRPMARGCAAKGAGLSDTDFGRREVLAGGVAAVALPTVSKAQAGKMPMYGLIGQMLAAPGKRDELLAILAEGTADMPGCLSYVLATDPANPEAIWITEVWTDKAAHAGSLKLPAVQAAIAKARPIIAGFPQRFETTPIGGQGLKA